jgi:hypothetical protein
MMGQAQNHGHDHTDNGRPNNKPDTVEEAFEDYPRRSIDPLPSKILRVP